MIHTFRCAPTLRSNVELEDTPSCRLRSILEPGDFLRSVLEPRDGLLGVPARVPARNGAQKCRFPFRSPLNRRGTERSLRNRPPSESRVSKTA